VNRMSLIAAATLFAAPVYADVPESLMLEAEIRGKGGAIPNGEMTLHFALYESMEGGEPMWEQSSVVDVEDGVVQVELLQVTPELVVSASGLYLGMRIGNDAELEPRLPFRSVPYALRAAYADNVLNDDDIKSSLDDDPRYPTVNDPCGDGQTVVFHEEMQKWSCADLPEGARGPAGPAGPPGVQGVAGPKGASGDGVTVAPLASGDASCPTGGVQVVEADGSVTPVCNGAAGPQGPIGQQGIQGPAGPPGATGAQGAAGPQGPAGDPGPAGAPGAIGAQGPAGPQGVAGPTGATGATGPQGIQGPQGASVSLAALAPGDPNCPFGGTSLSVGASTSYACNGAPVASNLVRREASQAATLAGDVTVVATCNPGESLVSGGCNASALLPVLNSSEPDLTTDSFTCVFTNATLGTVRAFAVCAQ
jgi:hypothetical protein